MATSGQQLVDEEDWFGFAELTDAPSKPKIPEPVHHNTAQAANEITANQVSSVNVGNFYKSDSDGTNVIKIDDCNEVIVPISTSKPGVKKFKVLARQKVEDDEDIKSVEEKIVEKTNLIDDQSSNECKKKNVLKDSTQNPERDKNLGKVLETKDNKKRLKLGMGLDRKFSKLCKNKVFHMKSLKSGRSNKNDIDGIDVHKLKKLTKQKTEIKSKIKFIPDKIAQKYEFHDDSDMETKKPMISIAEIKTKLHTKVLHKKSAIKLKSFSTKAMKKDLKNIPIEKPKPSGKEFEISSSIEKCHVTLKRDPSIDSMQKIIPEGIAEMNPAEIVNKKELKRKISEGDLSKLKEVKSDTGFENRRHSVDVFESSQIKRQKSVDESKVKNDMVYNADIEVRKSGRLQSAKCASRYRGNYGIRADTYTRIVQTVKEVSPERDKNDEENMNIHSKMANIVCNENSVSFVSEKDVNRDKLEKEISDNNSVKNINSNIKGNSDTKTISHQMKATAMTSQQSCDFKRSNVVPKLTNRQKYNKQRVLPKRRGSLDLTHGIKDKGLISDKKQTASSITVKENCNVEKTGHEAMECDSETINRTVNDITCAQGNCENVNDSTVQSHVAIPGKHVILLTSTHNIDKQTEASCSAQETKDETNKNEDKRQNVQPSKTSTESSFMNNSACTPYVPCLYNTEKGHNCDTMSGGLVSQSSGKAISDICSAAVTDSCEICCENTVTTESDTPELKSKSVYRKMDNKGVSPVYEPQTRIGYQHSVGKSVNRKQNQLFKRKVKKDVNPIEDVSSELTPDSSPEKLDPIKILETLRQKLFSNAGANVAKADEKPKNFESKLISSEIKASKTISYSEIRMGEENVKDNILNVESVCVGNSETKSDTCSNKSGRSTPRGSISKPEEGREILDEVAKTLDTMHKEKTKTDTANNKHRRDRIKPKHQRFEQKKFLLRSMLKRSADKGNVSITNVGIEEMKKQKLSVESNTSDMKCDNAISADKQYSDVESVSGSVKSRHPSSKSDSSSVISYISSTKSDVLDGSEKSLSSRTKSDKVVKTSQKKKKKIASEKRKIAPEIKPEDKDDKKEPPKPKPVKCQACGHTFKSKELLRKHYPCRIRQTRTWSQNKLRPNRAVRRNDSIIKKDGKFVCQLPKSRPESKTTTIRPQLLTPRKTKFRRVKGKRRRKLFQHLQELIAKRQITEWPHLCIEYEGLTFKEQCLYKLGLLCIGDSSEGLDQYSSEESTWFEKHRNKEHALKEEFLNFVPCLPDPVEETVSQAETETTDAEGTKTGIPNTETLTAPLNQENKTLDSDIRVKPTQSKQENTTSEIETSPTAAQVDDVPESFDEEVNEVTQSKPTSPTPQTAELDNMTLPTLSETQTLVKRPNEPLTSTNVKSVIETNDVNSFKVLRSILNNKPLMSFQLLSYADHHNANINAKDDKNEQSAVIETMGRLVDEVVESENSPTFDDTHNEDKDEISENSVAIEEKATEVEGFVECSVEMALKAILGNHGNASHQTEIDKEDNVDDIQESNICDKLITEDNERIESQFEKETSRTKTEDETLIEELKTVSIHQTVKRKGILLNKNEKCIHKKVAIAEKEKSVKHDVKKLTLSEYKRKRGLNSRTLSESESIKSVKSRTENENNDLIQSENSESNKPHLDDLSNKDESRIGSVVEESAKEQAAISTEILNVLTDYQTSKVVLEKHVNKSPENKETFTLETKETKCDNELIITKISTVTSTTGNPIDLKETKIGEGLTASLDNDIPDITLENSDNLQNGDTNISKEPELVDISSENDHKKAKKNTINEEQNITIDKKILTEHIAGNTSHDNLKYSKDDLFLKSEHLEIDSNNEIQEQVLNKSEYTIKYEVSGIMIRENLLTGDKNIVESADDSACSISTEETSENESALTEPEEQTTKSSDENSVNQYESHLQEESTLSSIHKLMKHTSVTKEIFDIASENSILKETQNTKALENLDEIENMRNEDVNIVNYELELQNLSFNEKTFEIENKKQSNDVESLKFMNLPKAVEEKVLLTESIDHITLIDIEAPPVLEKEEVEKCCLELYDVTLDDNSQQSGDHPPFLEPALEIESQSSEPEASNVNRHVDSNMKPRAERHFLDVLGDVCEKPNLEMARHFSDIMDADFATTHKPKSHLDSNVQSKIHSLFDRSEKGEVTLAHLKEMLKTKSNKENLLPEKALLKLRADIAGFMANLKVPMKKDPAWLKRDSLVNYSKNRRKKLKKKKDLNRSRGIFDVLDEKESSSSNESNDESEVRKPLVKDYLYSDEDYDSIPRSEIDLLEQQSGNKANKDSIRDNILQMLTSFEAKGSLADNMSNLLDILASNLGFLGKAGLDNDSVSSDSEYDYSRASQPRIRKETEETASQSHVSDDLDEPPCLDDIPTADHYDVDEDDIDDYNPGKPNAEKAREYANAEEYLQEIEDSHSELKNKMYDPSLITQLSFRDNEMKKVKPENKIDIETKYEENRVMKMTKEHKARTKIFKSITELNSIETDEESNNDESYDDVSMSQKLSELKALGGEGSDVNSDILSNYSSDSEEGHANNNHSAILLGNSPEPLATLNIEQDDLHTPESDTVTQLSTEIFDKPDIGAVNIEPTAIEVCAHQITVGEENEIVRKEKEPSVERNDIISIDVPQRTVLDGTESVIEHKSLLLEISQSESVTNGSSIPNQICHEKVEEIDNEIDLPEQEQKLFETEQPCSDDQINTSVNKVSTIEDIQDNSTLDIEVDNKVQEINMKNTVQLPDLSEEQTQLKEDEKVESTIYKAENNQTCIDSKNEVNHNTKDTISKSSNLIAGLISEIISTDTAEALYEPYDPLSPYFSRSDSDIKRLRTISSSIKDKTPSVPDSKVETTEESKHVSSERIDVDNQHEDMSAKDDTILNIEKSFNSLASLLNEFVTDIKAEAVKYPTDPESKAQTVDVVDDVDAEEHTELKEDSETEAKLVEDTEKLTEEITSVDSVEKEIGENFNADVNDIEDTQKLAEDIIIVDSFDKNISGNSSENEVLRETTCIAQRIEEADNTEFGPDMQIENSCEPVTEKDSLINNSIVEVLSSLVEDASNLVDEASIVVIDDGASQLEKFVAYSTTVLRQESVTNKEAILDAQANLPDIEVNDNVQTAIVKETSFLKPNTNLITLTDVTDISKIKDGDLSEVSSEEEDMIPEALDILPYTDKHQQTHSFSNLIVLTKEETPLPNPESTQNKLVEDMKEAIKNLMMQNASTIIARKRSQSQSSGGISEVPIATKSESITDEISEDSNDSDVEEEAVYETLDECTEELKLEEHTQSQYDCVTKDSIRKTESLNNEKPTEVSKNPVKQQSILSLEANNEEQNKEKAEEETRMKEAVPVYTLGENDSPLDVLKNDLGDTTDSDEDQDDFDPEEMVTIDSYISEEDVEDVENREEIEETESKTDVVKLDVQENYSKVEIEEMVNTDIQKVDVQIDISNVEMTGINSETAAELIDVEIKLNVKDQLNKDSFNDEDNKEGIDINIEGTLVNSICQEGEDNYLSDVEVPEDNAKQTKAENDAIPKAYGLDKDGVEKNNSSIIDNKDVQQKEECYTVLDDKSKELSYLSEQLKEKTIYDDKLDKKGPTDENKDDMEEENTTVDSNVDEIPEEKDSEKAATNHSNLDNEVQNLETCRNIEENIKADEELTIEIQEEFNLSKDINEKNANSTLLNKVEDSKTNEVEEHNVEIKNINSKYDFKAEIHINKTDSGVIPENNKEVINRDHPENFNSGNILENTFANISAAGYVSEDSGTDLEDELVYETPDELIEVPVIQNIGTSARILKADDFNETKQGHVMVNIEAQELANKASEDLSRIDNSTDLKTRDKIKCHNYKEIFQKVLSEIIETKEKIEETGITNSVVSKDVLEKSDTSNILTNQSIINQEETFTIEKNMMRKDIKQTKSSSSESKTYSTSKVACEQEFSDDNVPIIANNNQEIKQTKSCSNGPEAYSTSKSVSEPELLNDNVLILATNDQEMFTSNKPVTYSSFKAAFEPGFSDDNGQVTVANEETALEPGFSDDIAQVVATNDQEEMLDYTIDDEDSHSTIAYSDSGNEQALSEDDEVAEQEDDISNNEKDHEDFQPRNSSEDRDTLTLPPNKEEKTEQIHIANCYSPEIKEVSEAVAVDDASLSKPTSPITPDNGLIEGSNIALKDTNDEPIQASVVINQSEEQNNPDFFCETIAEKVKRKQKVCYIPIPYRCPKKVIKSKTPTKTDNTVSKQSEKSKVREETKVSETKGEKSKRTKKRLVSYQNEESNGIEPSANISEYDAEIFRKFSDEGFCETIAEKVKRKQRERSSRYDFWPITTRKIQRYEMTHSTGMSIFRSAIQEKKLAEKELTKKVIPELEKKDDSVCDNVVNNTIESQRSRATSLTLEKEENSVDKRMVERNRSVSLCNDLNTMKTPNIALKSLSIELQRDLPIRSDRERAVSLPLENKTTPLELRRFNSLPEHRNITTVNQPEEVKKMTAAELRKSYDVKKCSVKLTKLDEETIQRYKRKTENRPPIKMTIKFSKIYVPPLDASYPSESCYSASSEESETDIDDEINKGICRKPASPASSIASSGSSDISIGKYKSIFRGKNGKSGNQIDTYVEEQNLRRTPIKLNVRELLLRANTTANNTNYESDTSCTSSYAAADFEQVATDIEQPITDVDQSITDIEQPNTDHEQPEQQSASSFPDKNTCLEQLEPNVKANDIVQPYCVKDLNLSESDSEDEDDLNENVKKEPNATIKSTLLTMPLPKDTTIFDTSHNCIQYQENQDDTHHHHENFHPPSTLSLQQSVEVSEHEQISERDKQEINDHVIKAHPISDSCEIQDEIHHYYENFQPPSTFNLQQTAEESDLNQVSDRDKREINNHIIVEHPISDNKCEIQTEQNVFVHSRQPETNTEDVNLSKLHSNTDKTQTEGETIIEENTIPEPSGSILDKEGMWESLVAEAIETISDENSENHNSEADLNSSFSSVEIDNNITSPLTSDKAQSNDCFSLDKFEINTHLSKENQSDVTKSDDINENAVLGLEMESFENESAAVESSSLYNNNNVMYAIETTDTVEVDEAVQNLESIEMYEAEVTTENIDLVDNVAMISEIETETVQCPIENDFVVQNSVDVCDIENSVNNEVSIDDCATIIDDCIPDPITLTEMVEANVLAETDKENKYLYGIDEDSQSSTDVFEVMEELVQESVEQVNFEEEVTIEEVEIFEPEIADINIIDSTEELHSEEMVEHKHSAAHSDTNLEMQEPIQETHSPKHEELDPSDTLVNTLSTNGAETDRNHGVPEISNEISQVDVDVEQNNEKINEKISSEIQIENNFPAIEKESDHEKTRNTNALIAYRFNKKVNNNKFENKHENVPEPKLFNLEENNHRQHDNTHEPMDTENETDSNNDLSKFNEAEQQSYVAVNELNSTDDVSALVDNTDRGLKYDHNKIEEKIADECLPNQEINLVENINTSSAQKENISTDDPKESNTVKDIPDVGICNNVLPESENKCPSQEEILNEAESFKDESDSKVTENFTDKIVSSDLKPPKEDTIKIITQKSEAQVEIKTKVTYSLVSDLYDDSSDEEMDEQENDTKPLVETDIVYSPETESADKLCEADITDKESSDQNLDCNVTVSNVKGNNKESEEVISEQSSNVKEEETYSKTPTKSPVMDTNILTETELTAIEPLVKLDDDINQVELIGNENTNNLENDELKESNLKASDDCETDHEKNTPTCDSDVIGPESSTTMERDIIKPKGLTEKRNENPLSILEEEEDLELDYEIYTNSDEDEHSDYLNASKSSLDLESEESHRHNHDLDIQVVKSSIVTNNSNAEHDEVCGRSTEDTDNVNLDSEVEEMEVVDEITEGVTDDTDVDIRDMKVVDVTGEIECDDEEFDFQIYKVENEDIASEDETE